MARAVLDRRDDSLPSYVLAVLPEGAPIPAGVSFIPDADRIAEPLDWLTLPLCAALCVVVAVAVLSGFWDTPAYGGLLALGALFFGGLLCVLISLSIRRTREARSVRRVDHRYGLFLFPEDLVVRRPDGSVVLVRRAHVTDVWIDDDKTNTYSYSDTVAGYSYSDTMVDYLPNGIEPGSTLRVRGSFGESTKATRDRIAAWLAAAPEGGAYRESPGGK